jgi:hypothetical protein
MKKFMLAVLASGMWVNFSEFIRNEFLFKQRWIDKYDSLGLVFPSSPVNGAVWVLWGFLFAGCIVYLIRKLNLKETLIIGWIMGFVLMWIVVGNMNFLPFGLLMVAVPWSIIEVALAVIIARRIIGMQQA